MKLARMLIPCSCWQARRRQLRAPKPLFSRAAASGAWKRVFEHVKGVTNVVSGYAGGSASDANYDTVSSEGTGHAEAVQHQL